MSDCATEVDPIDLAAALCATLPPDLHQAVYEPRNRPIHRNVEITKDAARLAIDTARTVVTTVGSTFLVNSS